MPDLSLFIDVQNRALVSGFLSNFPASLPQVYQGDTLALSLRFMLPTGTSGQPYQDLDYSAAEIKAGAGFIGTLPTAGTFTLSDPDTSQTTSAIAFNAANAVVQTAIQSALTTNWSTATVTGPAGGPWVITNGVNGAKTALQGSSSSLTPLSVVVVSPVQNGDAGTPSIQYVKLTQSPIAYQNVFTEGPGYMPSVSIASVQTGILAVSSLQQVTLTGSPTGGTFTITSPTDSFTTAPLAHDATVVAVQTAFGAAYTVTGTDGGPWTIARVATGPISALTVNTSGLTGGTPGATVTNVTSGVIGINAVQSITLMGAPYAGSYTINFGSGTSLPISPTYTAAQVQSALAAATSIGTNNIAVVGNAGGPFIVTFTGTLGLQPQTLMTSIASLIAPLTMVGSLGMNTGSIEEAIGESASIQVVFEIQVTPSGGNPVTVLQVPLTIGNDLIQGAPSVPTPTDTYYTKTEADARFAQLAPTNGGYRIVTSSIGTAFQLYDTGTTTFRDIYLNNGALVVV